MKLKLVKILALTAVIGATGYVSTNNVQAARAKVVKEKTYRTKKYHLLNGYNYVPVWNKKHTKTAGKLSSAVDTTTFNVSATQTVKQGKHKTKFYRVNSEDAKNKYVGYVQTAYFGKGKYDRNALRYVYDPFTGRSLATSLIDNKLNKKLVKLFPGVTWDKQVQLATLFAMNSAASKDVTYLGERILGPANLKDVVQLRSYKRYKGKESGKDRISGLYKFAKKQIIAQLKKQGKTVNDFKGYRIGVYTVPDKYVWSNNYYGNVFVYLVPGTAKLPQLDQVYFDADGDGIPKSAIDNELNDTVMSLFPGTVKDDQIQLAADLIIAKDQSRNNDEGTDDIDFDLPLKTLIGEDNADKATEIDISLRLTNKDLSVDKFTALVKSQLAKQNVKLSDYEGYKIGAYVVPYRYTPGYKNDANASDSGGSVKIILMPPSVELPSFSNHIFDLAQDNILK